MVVKINDLIEHIELLFSVEVLGIDTALKFFH